MQRHEGAGTVLVAAGLREHHKLIDAAQGERDWAGAKALYHQVCCCLSPSPVDIGWLARCFCMLRTPPAPADMLPPVSTGCGQQPFSGVSDCSSSADADQSMNGLIFQFWPRLNGPSTMNNVRR